ncbi:MAG: 4Fe-4S dicluster domain-containing protein [Anaerolineales bacterium]|nr:MAG: 4Fe-4S dicluster domain-containing protein [Anaerolineales bacterium]
MDIATTISLMTLGLVMLLGFGAFGLFSVWESERRAAYVALGAAALTSLPLLLSCLLPVAVKLVILGVIVAGGIVGVVLFLLPIGQVERGNDVPQQRFDERDVMFARARLILGSPEYVAYYAMRPENRAGDDKIRTLPGLLSPTASKTDPLAFASAEASFSLTEALREEVDGPVAPVRLKFAAAQMASYIKSLARYYGAYTVGITELQPYHIYSHIGRGSGDYGAPITLDHRSAIAFAVEMDHAMMGPAPDAPVVMESARQYVEAAKIALQLAYLIRSLGYPARAHIDGNYRVIAPLVARDASLGDIGRMGLLMTPELGPRVRLGVVTTDLPLIPDQRSDDTSVIDFCCICKKCAENCPSRSIPLGDREEIDGALRWRINSDSCFRYWNLIGTDCGLCMAVCPYSHPNNPAHNLVRWAVWHSGLARRAVLWMDDVFYGRKPAPRPALGWIPQK